MFGLSRSYQSCFVIVVVVVVFSEEKGEPFGVDITRFSSISEYCEYSMENGSVRGGTN